MHSAEKLDLLIQAIVAARKNRSKPYATLKLDFGPESPLSLLGRTEGLSILERLQRENRVIELAERNYPSTISDKKILQIASHDPETGKKEVQNFDPPIPVDIPQPDSKALYFSLKDSFDNWLSHYNTVRSRKLEDMSRINFLAMLEVTRVIQNKMQLSFQPTIVLDLDFPSTVLTLEDTLDIEDIEKLRNEILNFMRQKTLIEFSLKEYFSYGGEGHSGGIRAEITVIVDHWDNFYKELAEEYARRTHKKASSVHTPPRTASLKNQPPFPDSLKWEDITLKFKDGENVEITTKEMKYIAHFKEMGMEDSRNRSPDLSWVFLKALANQNGQVSWQDSSAHPNIKKRKQILSTKLRKYFGIAADPFLPYKQEKSYSIRIHLLP